MLGLLEINANIHSIKISDGTNDLAIDGSGYLTANVNGEVSINDGGNAITVDGSVDAVQSGTWDIGTVTTLTGITNDVNIADGGNSITIDDGGASITVDGAVATTPAAFDSWKTTVETVGATAAQILSTALASRLKVIFQNISNANDVCIGEDNTVTMTGSTAGLLIPKKGHFEELFGASADIYAIAGGAGTELRCIEFAD